MIRYRTLVSAIIIVILFVWPNSVPAQNAFSPKGDRIYYRDSTLVFGQTSIHFIYGTNLTLGLKFWSRDLLRSIEYSWRYSKSGPLWPKNLYAFSMEAYLGRLPDTSHWCTYQSPHLAISFRYPPDLDVVERFDTATHARLVELGVMSHLDSLAQRRDTFLTIIRMSITYENFTKVAASHGWHPLYDNCWYVFKKEQSSVGALYDVAYIEGNQ